MSISDLQKEIVQDKINLADERHEFGVYKDKAISRIQRQEKHIEYHENEIKQKEECLKESILQEQLHNKAMED